MGKKVLVVDDEKEIADLVEVYLKNDGYEVLKFYNATDALHCVMEEQEPDLALLDVMLPDMSGFTLCQKIREKYLFPIIMLTAKVEDMDKITGLTLGADDYITKPFNPLELMARVKTQLRRYTRYNPGSMEPEETLPADEIDIRCSASFASIAFRKAPSRTRFSSSSTLFIALDNRIGSSPGLASFSDASTSSSR